MALLSVNNVNQVAVDLSALAVAAAAGGDSVKAAPNLMITVFNGDAGSHTATFAKPQTSQACPPFGNLDLADIAVVVPAGQQRSVVIPDGWADASGDFAWTYDDVTSVDVVVNSLA